MKARLSILNMFAMDGGGKMIGLLLSYPVLINLSVYILKFRVNTGTAESFFAILSDPIVQRTIIVEILAYWVLLVLILCRIGIKKKYTSAFTVQRLSVSEYEYCLLQAIYGTIVSLAFYGMIIVSIYGLKMQYLLYNPNVTDGELFMAFRNSFYLRFFMPMKDNTQKVLILFFCLSAGINAACECCRIRHGKRGTSTYVYLYMVAYIGVSLARYTRNMTITHLQDWQMGQTFLIAVCLAFIIISVISIVFQIKYKEERVIEDDQRFY